MAETTEAEVDWELLLWEIDLPPVLYNTYEIWSSLSDDAVIRRRGYRTFMTAWMAASPAEPSASGMQMQTVLTKIVLVLLVGMVGSMCLLNHGNQ